MRASTWIAPFAAVFLIACSPLQTAPPAQPNLKGEVATFLEQYLAAISSRDAANIRNAYVNDDRFVWIEDGKVRYRQVDEVLASLAAFPAGSSIRTELADLTVVPVGESTAHAWASFRTTVGEGQRAFSFGGAISFTLERTGKSWKIVGGHTSSPSRR
jgi:hypothetical protein